MTGKPERVIFLFLPVASEPFPGGHEFYLSLSKKFHLRGGDGPLTRKNPDRKYDHEEASVSRVPNTVFQIKLVSNAMETP